MNTLREQASQIFKSGVNVAVNRANQSGFVATTRFTFLADMMQIQCLLADDMDKLDFILPLGLYTTVMDLVAHNEAKISTYKTKFEACFALKFATEDDQDKFIQFFELILLRNARAYPAPDLYLGSRDIDKDFGYETLNFLHEVVQNQYEGGWSNIR